jgi:hypothetical protein
MHHNSPQGLTPCQLINTRLSFGGPGSKHKSNADVAATTKATATSGNLVAKGDVVWARQGACTGPLDHDHSEGLGRLVPSIAG